MYHRAVRRAQESTELALEAVLRLIGVEYPKEHDIGGSLLRVGKKKLPELVCLKLAGSSGISKLLAEQRGPSFYGG
jgi:HEPN domain-containing protein